MSTKIDQALNALRTLPDETQNALAHELMERVADFSTPHLTDLQRAEVARRLSKPRTHASDDSVRALFQQYNPAL